MSLAGRLEEVELPEILQFLAINARTGKLALSRRDARGTVVLRQGRIVYAASSSIREALGAILLARGLVAREALSAALERQHLAADGRKLGEILVETGQLAESDLAGALAEQTGLVVQELCRWREGYFRFELAPVAASGDIGVDAEELVVPGGVATERLLLEALTRSAESDEAAPGASALEIAASLTAPSLGGEVAAELLQQAAAVVARGVLLVVRGDEARGAAQIGLGRAVDADELVHSICLPLTEPSVVADAVARRETYRGPVPPCPANDRLLQLLGGERPSEAIAVPMLVHDAAGLVFYGDNSPGLRPLGDATALEWALLGAALAMERDVLERRLAEFERARGYRP
jgi:hypothetical protein